jgi:hypothetical protein
MIRIEVEKHNNQWTGRLYQATQTGWYCLFLGKAYPNPQDALQYCRDAAHQKGYEVHETIIWGNHPDQGKVATFL